MSLVASEGSAGKATKCKISAAEVPIYRLSSVPLDLLLEYHSMNSHRVLLTPEFHTRNVDIWPRIFGYHRYLIEKLLEDIGSSFPLVDLSSLAGVSIIIFRHNEI